MTTPPASFGQEPEDPLYEGFPARPAVGLRTPETTPHALRHTRATVMREMSPQWRLGRAGPESVKVYTRVSDEAVPAAYTHPLEHGQENKR